MESNEGLKREIGVWGLTSNAINITVGAGIFVLPVIVAEKLGPSSSLAYIVCGILVFLIMLCFADIGSKIVITGGAYSYIEEAFGKYVGFITTNLFVFGYALLANAAVSNALLDTLAYYFPVLDDRFFRSIVLLVMYSGLAIVNILGINSGMFLVKFNTIAKLVPLVILVFFGLTKVSSENLTFQYTSEISDIGEVSLILFFAFAGIETALNVSGEIKNPAKTIPKGIFLSVLSILILYILIQITTQGVLGASLKDYESAPLVEVASRLMGPLGALMIVIGSSFSMFGNLSGETLNMPRVVYAAARDHVIPPKALSKIHSKYLTPHVSIIAYASVGCLLSIFGEFKQLAMLSSASILLIYLGVALAVIKFRKEHKSLGSFSLPGGIIIPAISAVSIVWLLSNLSKNELIGSLVFLLILTVIHLVMRVFMKEKK